MNFKKTIAGISALSMLLSTSAVSAVNAFAADEETKNYTDKTINAYLYSNDNVDTMTARFYNDKPNIPYLRISEFYKKWLDQDLEITNKNDGTYDVKVPFGTVGTFDVEKDTIHSDDVGKFFIPEEDANSTSAASDLFIREEEAEEKAVDMTFDFGAYNIDFLGDENDIWLPAPTLCDLFAGTDKQSLYLDGSMYFCGYLLSDYSRLSIPQTQEHITNLIEDFKDGRPADLIKYNYDEFCFLMDSGYGYPGRIPFNDLMKEKGFDAMLEEGNETTKKIKELLNSTDLYEYCAGLELLNGYFFDGGHTSFLPIPYTYDANFEILDGEFAAKVDAVIDGLGELKDHVDLKLEEKNLEASIIGVENARKAMAETADYTEELSSSVYYEKGDVAVLMFDTFVIDLDSWDGYYHNGAELPEDEVTDFYKAVQKADSNPAIKKLVFDVATNTGGNMMTAMYMMNLIKGLNSVSLKNTSVMAGDSEDGLITDDFKTDRNFDKVIDEKDDAIKFDLQYGVITSKMSFSCGNWFPSLCKDNNIVVIGERSGGGSCAVDLSVLPDGMIYSYSTGITLVDSKGESIDLGIQPDYENVKIAEDGSKDFSETFNFDNISKIFDEFYGNTTTTPAETETTTTTTTTSATTSTTTSSTNASTDTTTTTTAATSTKSEETTTATATTKAEDKTIGTNDEITKMVEKDYFVKTGKNAASSETNVNKDGTLTVELKDENGNVIDKYTVDPETGKGTDADGNEVDLPQTGINSLGTAGAAVGAVMLMLAGAAAVHGSGVLRKKEND